MEFEKLFNDAIEYARDTFIGHWARWLIFILLGLPFALIQFVIDPRKIVSGATIRWDLIPWGSIAALAIAGILASFLISGYMVRIYRGMKPAPDFTGWPSLFIDGIKLDIVVFVWFLPAIILMLLVGVIFLGGLLWPGILPGPGNPLPILALLIIFAAAMILLIAAALYVTLGAIRFARTGSMIEGWRFSAISGIIRQIGWRNYIIALILFFLAAILFNVAISIPAVIPYVGWIVPVCLSPFLTVFSARYFMLVYTAGELPAAAFPAPPAP